MVSIICSLHRSSNLTNCLKIVYNINILNYRSWFGPAHLILQIGNISETWKTQIIINSIITRKPVASSGLVVVYKMVIFLFSAEQLAF